MTFWNQRCRPGRGQRSPYLYSGSICTWGKPTQHTGRGTALTRDSRGSTQLLGHPNPAPSKPTFKKSVIRRAHPAIWQTHSIWAWNILFHKSLFPAPLLSHTYKQSGQPIRQRIILGLSPGPGWKLSSHFFPWSQMHCFFIHVKGRNQFLFYSICRKRWKNIKASHSPVTDS